MYNTQAEPNEAINVQREVPICCLTHLTSIPPTLPYDPIPLLPEVNAGQEMPNANL